MLDQQDQSAMFSQIQASLPGEKLIAISQIPKTLSGNLFVITTDNGNYIAKMAHTVVQKKALSKENHVYALLSAHSIPCAEIVDFRETDGGPQLLLMRKLEGEPIGRIFESLDTEAKSRLYYNLGKQVAAINNITGTEFGDVWLSDVTYPEWHSLLSKMLEDAQQILWGSVFSTPVAQVVDWVQANLRPDAHLPSLLHTDLH